MKTITDYFVFGLFLVSWIYLEMLCFSILNNFVGITFWLKRHSLYHVPRNRLSLSALNLWDQITCLPLVKWVKHSWHLIYKDKESGAETCLGIMLYFLEILCILILYLEGGYRMSQFQMSPIAFSSITVKNTGMKIQDTELLGSIISQWETCKVLCLKKVGR